MSKQKDHKQQQFNPMVQHGNLARIDPKINVVEKYQFYTVIQQDCKKTGTTIPIADWDIVKPAKQEIYQKLK